MTAAPRSVSAPTAHGSPAAARTHDADGGPSLTGAEDIPPRDLPRRPRRIRDATRAKYIRLAAELAARPEPVSSHWHTVSQVSIAATAARMGVARTALYRHWGSATEFWTDLTRYLVTEDREPIIGAGVAHVMDAPDVGDSPMDRTRQSLNAIERAVTSDPWLTLRAALLVRPDDPTLAPLLAAATQRLIDAVALHLTRVLNHLDRVPADGVTIADLAAGLFCVTDGLATAGQITPRVVEQDIVLDGDAARPWGLLAYASRCIVERCTHLRRRADPPIGPPPSTAPHDLRAALRFSAAKRAALEVAAELYRETLRPDGDVADEAARGPLDHVTIARLASYAGVSRRALHHVWPGQIDLTADLLAHITQRERRAARRALREATRRGLASPGDTVVHAVDAGVRRFADLSVSARLGQLLYASPSRHPRLHEVTRASLEAALLDWSADVTDVLGRHHRTTRPGITTDRLAAVQLLTEVAAGRLHRTNPVALRTDIAYRGGRWSIMAIVLDAVVRSSITTVSA